MSFHDVPEEVAEDRTLGMGRDGDERRRVSTARPGQRARARRPWTLRRQGGQLRLGTVARTANELVGAIISPPWPTSDEPHRHARPGPTR
jgi:hypothetical protein